MTDEPVTRYDARSERVTNDVCNAAPHHTTPHHTTKNTSSRSVALRPDQPAEHLTGVILSLRPDWTPDAVWMAINGDDRDWRTVVVASINGAADPGIRHPNGLRYVNAGFGDTAPPRLPSVAEALNPQLDAHGFRVGACPICRRTT